MAAETPVSAGQAARPVTESQAWSLPGVRLLVSGIVTTLAGIAVLLVNSFTNGGGILILLAIVILIGAELQFHGLTAVVAGEGRVVQLFGRYNGTIRAPGLHWVNPLARKRRVSVRLRNHETAVAKVNDADGNPIEIAAVVVWQVAETAVRHIASRYPYTSQDGSALSLRDNAEEITRRLSEEIAERVRPAGVHIVESRLTRLSYAPEIAQAMLRQQQASAVVGARMKIVEGAVGMVRLALQRLEEEGVVELDEERKAAMVSNLLVVLCSEQATQQVVNTGSLYN